MRGPYRWMLVAGDRAVVEVVSDDPPAFEDSGCSGLSQLGFAPVWSGDPFIPNEALDEVTGVWIPGSDPHGGWVETPYGPFRSGCSIFELFSRATGVFATDPVSLNCGVQITETTPQAIADFESALGSGLVMSPPFVFYEMP